MPVWDMGGPIHDRPGLGAHLFVVPPDPDRFTPIPVSFGPSVVQTAAPTDLQPVVAGLAALTLELHSLRLEHELLRHRLTPWYERLWTWIRQLGR